MEFEFYSVEIDGELIRTNPSRFHPGERRSRWPNRPRGPWNARARRPTPSARGGRGRGYSAGDGDRAPSTALRLLRTLENTGFVTREEVGGTYRPGSRLM